MHNNINLMPDQGQKSGKSPFFETCKRKNID